MATVELAPKALDPILRERVSARLAKELAKPGSPGTPEQAGAALDEALLYLWLVANHDEVLPPSPLVDEGWHTFILYTREYEEYCLDAYGLKIHHCPADDPREPALSSVALDTATFMRERDIPFNAEMWPGSADCNRCCKKPDGVTEDCHRPRCAKPCRPVEAAARCYKCESQTQTAAARCAHRCDVVKCKPPARPNTDETTETTETATAANCGSKCKKCKPVVGEAAKGTGSGPTQVQGQLPQSAGVSPTASTRCEALTTATCTRTCSGPAADGSKPRCCSVAASA